MAPAQRRLLCFRSVRPTWGCGGARKIMIRGFCCCLLLTVTLAATAQQSGPREAKLLVLERLWNEAQVNRDSSALDALVSDHFIDTEWDGEVSNKTKFLADIRDPLFKPTSVNIQEAKVNLFGDTAVITGVYRTQGTYHGKPYDHLGRFTDTWIEENGKWQCVASHTSLMKK